MSKPKIRFEGHSDDWEQRKLGEMADRVQGNDGRMNLNTLTISAGNGWMKQEDRFSSNIAGKEQQNYTLLKKGELSYNHGNSKLAKYGAVFELRDYEEALVPRVYHSFRVNSKADAGFVEYMFATKLPDRELGKLISSGARMDGLLNISYDEFMSINIMLPSVREQVRIRDILRQMDSLITLHQRKCEEAKTLKKYMLQKMFPQNGMKVPEIRFKGFTGDWEQRKLGEVLLGLQNNTLSRAELSYDEGTVKNVHYGDILVKYGEIIDVKNEQLPNIIDEKIAEKYKASFLQNGDIVFADTAEDETVGKCSEIAGLTDEMIISGLHTIPYRPQLKFATGYLGYYFNSSEYHRQLAPLMQGIKVTSISKSAMQDTKVKFPKAIDEQAKIGCYFRNLDTLLTLHQRKCEELQCIKKYMLQNMFV